MITRSVIEELRDRFGAQLDEFIQLFHRWNQKINLSAARSVEEIREHVTDSLHVVPLLDNAARVLDVGSGGGFPVAIASICLPNTRFVSLEPVHKKHAFLRTATRELGLNLEAHAERLEQHVVRDYDVAMSRATFAIDDWLSMGRDYVRGGGLVIGFEAEIQTTHQVVRHGYALGSKTRSLVVLTT